MGILRNVVGLTQYRIEGKVPKDAFDAWTTERLAKFGFLSIDEVVKESSVGWTSMDNIHDSSFEDRRSHTRMPYLCFSLRQDERKVPQSVLRHQLDLECKNWLAKNPDIKYVPKGRKSEFKELIYRKLLSKTLAIPSIYDVVWNTNTNVVSLASLNPKVLEAFEKLFKQTFDGLFLVLIHPMSRAENVVDNALLSALAAQNKAGSDNIVDQIKDNLWLGHDFLLWLIHATVHSSSDYLINQEGPAELKEPFVAYINSRLQVMSESSEEGTKKIVFTGPQNRFREAQTALANNLQPIDASIYMEKDEDIWKLTLKGEMFQFSSFKTPKVHLEKDELTDETDEKESLFYERMYLLELGQQMFDSLLAEFLSIRLTNKWGAKKRKILEWCKS